MGMGMGSLKSSATFGSLSGREGRSAPIPIPISHSAFPTKTQSHADNYHRHSANHIVPQKRHLRRTEIHCRHRAHASQQTYERTGAACARNHGEQEDAKDGTVEE